MRLQPGSRAVVTGAASGIGFELSRQLVQRGLSVVMADIGEHALEAAARTCGAEAVTPDVRDHKALARLADHVGVADLVCSNAGMVSPWAPVWLTTDGDLSWVLDVNVRGTLNTLRAFAPAIDRDAGHILVTGSFVGLSPAPYLGLYAASKHAITGLTTTLSRPGSGRPAGTWASRSSPPTWAADPRKGISSASWVQWPRCSASSRPAMPGAARTAGDGMSGTSRCGQWPSSRNFSMSGSSHSG
jgi:NAD(P)-dependent dehydrogenase (short-subunit alcohol dehydrogenase family)